MTDMKTLDTLDLPLNGTALIEASAGTGKTFTMANLYLRLLLGIGCAPLSVERILVVTFTKAATEELRDRIRRNIKACREFFRLAEKGESDATSGHFYHALYQKVPNAREALLRLKIAESEIDLAAIFTIHSFCQKMLFQFAFDSGVRFDSDLQADESELLQRLSEETWRELFYPLGLAEANAVAAELRSPSSALEAVRPLIFGELPELRGAQKKLLEQDLSEYLRAEQVLLAEAKKHWRENQAAILAPIRTELAKKYKTGEKKSLSRIAYKSNLLPKWIAETEAWANGDAEGLPKSFERFCQSMLEEKAEEGAEPLRHALFAENQRYWSAYRTGFEGKRKPLLLYRFLQAMRAKLADYKESHSEKSFNDMLSFLNRALKGDRGEALAEQIRRQFPFAMIDEFQDTDKEQYEIFHKIFMSGAEDTQGFIMIGDPKQSIYKFRGADIFTYLQAARQAQEKRTLPKNWRSHPELVAAVNALFQFPETSAQPPFLYQDIRFRPAEAKEAEAELVGGSHFNCFLQRKFGESLAAEQCAYQIQQQLKGMQAGEFGLRFANRAPSVRPFAAKDISVLVRSKSQAALMKNALAQRGIRSVFLSEDRSVFASNTAKELLWILHACLNPYHQGRLLTALGSALWGLTASDIHRLKNDELQWDLLVDEFIGYQRIWRGQGVLPMLHRLFMREGVIERILSNPLDSERRLTDLLHLTELLQNAMSGLENESALVRWYERQLRQPRKQEDQMLRLESEEALIKIVTIHGSKGLQYPIVWLPFIGKPSAGVRASALSLYHDEQGEMQWTAGSPDGEAKELMNKSEYAEELRLLYVALTRAESQLNVILPKRFERGWNAFRYLLRNGSDGDGNAEETDCAADFRAKKIRCEVTESVDSVPSDDWRADSEPPPAFASRIFTGHIRRDGQLTSFSALHAYNEWREQNGVGEDFAESIDFVQDDDRQVKIEESFGMREEIEPYSAYRFPHSTKVGSLLHRFLEHYDFQQAVEFEPVFILCRQLNLGEEWVEPTRQWFERVRSTPFGDEPFCLKDIPTTRRLNEWQFYLRLKNAEALKKLNDLLRRYSAVSKSLPELQLPQVEGYVRGFVDCIVQVNDKFYLIDYKSNFLGYTVQDYSRENLFKTIGQYRYDLQYLLYCLALHRYLASRLAKGYDYDRDFGGAAYLFLRGMDGSPDSGVFFDKPPKALIEEMDKLFG